MDPDHVKLKICICTQTLIAKLKALGQSQGAMNDDAFRDYLALVKEDTAKYEEFANGLLPGATL